MTVDLQGVKLKSGTNLVIPAIPSHRDMQAFIIKGYTTTQNHQNQNGRDTPAKKTYY